MPERIANILLKIYSKPNLKCKSSYPSNLSKLKCELNFLLGIYEKPIESLGKYCKDEPLPTLGEFVTIKHLF